MDIVSLATKQIAKVLKTGDTVIYESTVFPGATEEICIPILEKYSKKKWQGRKDAPWEADANKESGTNYGR